MREGRAASALVPALLAIAVLLGAAGLWSRAREVVGIDFFQFWAVGRAGGVAPADPYTPAGREAIAAAALARSRDTPYRQTAARYRRELETYGSPLLYASFVALSSESYERDLLAFQALSLAAFVAGLLGAARAVGLPRAAQLALLAGLLEWSEPLYSDVSVGNVGRLQVAAAGAVLVLLASASRGRLFYTGLLLALAVAFKPTLALLPVALLAVLLARRAAREVAVLAAGLAAGGGAALLAALAAGFRPSSWRGWVAAVRSMPDSQITLQMGNYGLRSMARAAAGLDPIWVLAAVAALVLAAAAWRGRKAAGAGRLLEEHRAVALACLLPLFLGRLVWGHYFLLAIPAAVVVLGRGGRDGGPSAWLAILGLLATATRRLLALTGGTFVAEAVLFNLGALLLLAALMSVPPAVEEARPASAGRST